MSTQSILSNEAEDLKDILDEVNSKISNDYILSKSIGSKLKSSKQDLFILNYIYSFSKGFNFCKILEEDKTVLTNLNKFLINF